MRFGPFWVALALVQACAPAPPQQSVHSPQTASEGDDLPAVSAAVPEPTEEEDAAEAAANEDVEEPTTAVMTRRASPSAASRGRTRSTA